MSFAWQWLCVLVGPGQLRNSCGSPVAFGFSWTPRARTCKMPRCLRWLELLRTCWVGIFVTLGTAFLVFAVLGVSFVALSGVVSSDDDNCGDPWSCWRPVLAPQPAQSDEWEWGQADVFRIEKEGRKGELDVDDLVAHMFEYGSELGLAACKAGHATVETMRARFDRALAVLQEETEGQEEACVECSEAEASGCWSSREGADEAVPVGSEVELAGHG